MPIDTLKIDRAFTAGRANGPLLTAVFDLASRRGLTTLAEGVERIEIPGLLRLLAGREGGGVERGRGLPEQAA